MTKDYLLTVRSGYADDHLFVNRRSAGGRRGFIPGRRGTVVLRLLGVRGTLQACDRRPRHETRPGRVKIRSSACGNTLPASGMFVAADVAGIVPTVTQRNKRRARDRLRDAGSHCVPLRDMPMAQAIGLGAELTIPGFPPWRGRKSAAPAGAKPARKAFA